MPPTKAQIDNILPYLDHFEAADFSAGEWNRTLGQMPWFDFDVAVMEFVTALYDNSWVTPSFDWMQWQASALAFVSSPKKIESADAEMVQRLFTTHVRLDRFCEGHLASMFENGHIVALLRRLKAIRNLMLEEEGNGVRP